LAAVGIPVRAGIAGTPLLAALAARSTETVCVVRAAAEFLRPLPLAWAEPTAAHAEVLAGWGVRTLGDLTALPKGEVGQRLGPAGAALWERAAGETTRPLKLVEPKKSFAAAWAYDPPVESLEPLLFLLRRYAERVALELRAAGFVAEKLALTLLLEDETDHRREFRLPEPGADVDGWQRILHAHLETLKTAARVVGVRLVATPARPPEKQDGLFETGLRDPAVFWESLARVGALVGDDRVGTPVVAATHRPDTFALTKPAEAVPEPEAAPVHAARGLVLRRFRPAWPVHVHCDGARPVEIVCGQIGGDVCAASGPWRSEGEWWTAAAWAVELWQVELAAGGLYQLARTANGWCVEGVFD
jgi:protein ImuB